MFDEPKSKSLDKNTFEELAVVYVLYFDEAHGHTPLLIYPDDRYKDDKKFMRPIKYHPIWFLGEGSFKTKEKTSRFRRRNPRNHRNYSLITK
ncbi:MAG: hypothetical protein P8Y23_17480 [Candidatus Lokiarchaeota archaeon]